MAIDNVASAASALIKDTTTQGFRDDVLVESTKQPVLVDFWAPWCEPCKQLTPVLEKLITAAGGKVKLVKLNIEEHPAIAGQLGIKSIPAVIACQQGQFVDGFMGAVPEAQIKAFIERLVGPLGPTPLEELLEHAAALAEQGDATGAAELYAAVLSQDAENLTAIVALSKLHLDLGDSEGAKRFLEMVPAKKANDIQVSAIRAAIELAEQAADLGDIHELQRQVEADAQNYQARFDLALALNARNQREEAANLLLEIVRRDRTWNEDGARKQLVQFFEAWGPTDPASISGRKRLSSVLFS